ncbi:uncharacterized protein [Nicotiana sylvestris]|uniref:Uncharacterized protein LOC104233809 isoform X1 n=1 Tax=Nicotiana sylvestris TaxID=4096 RepID=A0A1U7XF34_NICSY|nr:PREDICTED: uncharacterized protein LOC104233809 isoform X1 [Nicotiana sylvestris]
MTMNQVVTTRKNKKETNSQYLPAGSLSSLAKEKFSLLTTKRAVPPNFSNRQPKHPRLGSQVQKPVRQLPLTSHVPQKVQEQVQQVPLDSSSPVATKGQEQVHRATLHSTASAAQAVLEQVQQVSQRSTASAAQAVLEQVQQVSQHSTSSAAQVVLEQVQQVLQHSTSSAAQVLLEQVPQMSQHSATHEVIEQSEKRGSSTVKRKRGRTQMPRVHGRSERKLAVLSDLNQPIGPTDEIVKELGSFLGTLARNSTFCPLNINNWKKLNTKEDMWTYIKTKYDIHDDGREWVFQSIQNAWRRKKKKETSEEPSSKDMFVATRSRKPGRVYKESYEDTMRKIAEMEQIQTQKSEDDNQSIDAFATVMGPEHPGRVRLYGRGVTKTILKQKSGNSGPSSKTTDEIMEQKMKEMEERMQQRMQKNFEEQQETWRQQITLNVVAQLQHINPDLRIHPNMLAFGGRSLREASSAQQAAIQLINRPSTSSTNQDQHLLGNATSPTCHVQTLEEDNRPPTSNALQTVLVATHKQQQRK